MNARVWLALAAVVLACTVPASVPARVGGLAAAGRLRAAARPADVAGRSLPWRWVAAAGVTALVGGVAAAGGALLAVAAAAVCGAAWLLGRDVAARRVASARRAQLLAALRVLIGELEAGARPAAALAAAAESGAAHAQVFGAAAATARAAGDAGSVLAAGQETRAIGLAWRLGEDTGAALAGVLARVAADLAAADDQRRTVAVALAGARASAALLAGLPLLGIALGVAMGAQPTRFLTGPSAGRAVCSIGVLLDVGGVLWMRRILRRAEQP